MNKILILPEFDLFGGTKTYFLHLIKYFKDRNGDVLVVGTERELTKEIVDLLDNNRFTYRYIPVRNRISNIFPLSVFYEYKYLKKIIESNNDRDIAITCGTPGIFFYPFCFKKRRIYYFIHTYPSDNKLYNYVIKQFLKRYLSTNHFIISVSKYSKEMIKKKWFSNRDKVKNLKYIYASPPSESQLITAPTYRNIVLTLGHVVWYKNPKAWLDVAIKVALQNQDVSFVWAGDGNETIEHLKNAIPISLRNRVTFIGYQQDVAKLYDKSIIYFQPSLIESLSISVLDAQMRGIPAVVSQVGGLPEIITNNINGFVIDPENTELMAEKILLLLENNKLRESFSKNSLSTFKNTFSYEKWENQLDRFFDLFDNRSD